jgi:hypothetical protein
MQPTDSETLNGDSVMKRWLLNIVLAVAVVFFAARIYGIWTQPDPLLREPTENESGAPVPTPSRALARRPQPATHYDVIFEKNLFTSERGEPLEVAAVINAKTVEESRFAKNIALYGTLTQGDSHSALVSTGGHRRGGGDVTWVQVGDKLDQVTVVGIERDRIYVREGASTFEIRLVDRGHPSKKASAQRPRVPTVITTKAAAPERRIPSSEANAAPEDAAAPRNKAN